jgi:hypothetical protein
MMTSRSEDTIFFVVILLRRLLQYLKLKNGLAPERAFQLLELMEEHRCSFGQFTLSCMDMVLARTRSSAASTCNSRSFAPAAWLAVGFRHGLFDVWVRRT